MSALHRHQAAWLLMIAALLRCAAVQGAPLRVFVVELPVRLDTVNAGKLLVGLQGADLLHVDAASWQRFAAPHVLPDVLAVIAGRASDGRITAEDLSASGVTLRYDPATLVLDITLAADIRVVTELSLRRRNQGGEPAADPFSAYANLRASQGFIVESATGQSRDAAVLAADGAARIGGAGGAALEWSAIYREGASTPVRRGIAERGERGGGTAQHLDRSRPVLGWRSRLRAVPRRLGVHGGCGVGHHRFRLLGARRRTGRAAGAAGADRAGRADGRLQRHDGRV